MFCLWTTKAKKIVQNKDDRGAEVGEPGSPDEVLRNGIHPQAAMLEDRRVSIFTILKTGVNPTKTANFLGACFNSA